MDVKYCGLPMIVVEKIVIAPRDLFPSERDSLPLDWEARQKCRQRLKTMAGREIGLALPTGTVLSPGDVLYRDDEVEIIIEGVDEKVIVMHLQTRKEFGLACYQIGNLHRPIGFDGDAILIPYEPVLEKQFERLGFKYTLEQRIFTQASRQTLSHSHVR